MNTETKYILGVDAAWSIKNPSGVALIECSTQDKPRLLKTGRSYEEFLKDGVAWNQKVTGSLPDFSTLINSIPRPTIIALDIPIAPFNVESRREVDQALSRAYGKYKAAVHSPTKDRPGKLATTIFEQLEAIGYKWAIEYVPENAFFEVYPHASIIELFGYSERFPYKVGKKAKYWPRASREERTRNLLKNLNELRDKLASVVEISEQLIPKLNVEQHYSIASLKGYEDLLDAVVCALTGYYYLKGRIKSFGDQQGVAWVPAREEISNERC